MSQDEAIQELERICENHDKETAHIESDDLLCLVLKELGWGELADKFSKKSQKFWYS